MSHASKKQQVAKPPSCQMRYTLDNTVTAANSTDPHLQKGLVVLIAQESTQIAGKIVAVSQNKLVWELDKPPSSPLQEGKQATIRYWDVGFDSHWWKTEVVSTSRHGQRVEASILEKGIESRAHKRFRVTIPFSFTISEAVRADLIGQQGSSKTISVSLGGLLFETKLPLRVGSKLQLDLHLSASQNMHANGLVVRSEGVARPKYVAGSMIVRPVNSIGLQFQQFENDGRSVLMGHLEPEKSTPERSVAEVAKGSNKISVS